MARKTPASCSRTPSIASGILAGGAALAAGWFFAQRVSVPPNVNPVDGFDVERYLGHWYEIGRIDFIFEKGLTTCTADYSLNDDGSVGVLNRGYDPKKVVWKSAKAVAKFVGDPSIASLKVSFFRPFYSGYHVVHVDDEYQTAVVVGDDSKYCWVLSRSPEMSEKVYRDLLSVAAANGVDTSRMHRVMHGAVPEGAAE